jgi:hypothetical protein
VVRTSLGWELKVGCVDIQKAVNEAVKKNDLFGPENVAKGKLNKGHVTLAEEAWMTVLNGKENSISATTEMPNLLSAPIQAGQAVEKVVISHRYGKALR